MRPCGLSTAVSRASAGGAAAIRRRRGGAGRAGGKGGGPKARLHVFHCGLGGGVKPKPAPRLPSEAVPGGPARGTDRMRGLSAIGAPANRETVPMERKWKGPVENAFSWLDVSLI